MSASAGFELNIKTDPKRLFQQLVDAWKPSRENGRSLTLTNRQNSSIQLHAPSLAEDSKAEIEKLLKAFQPVVDKAASSIVNDLKQKFPETQSQPKEPYSMQGLKVPRKDWLCFVDYYYYTQKDRDDFLKLTRVLCDCADGDIVYYREPTGMGDIINPVSIKFDEILNFEPSMDDFRPYLITTQIKED
ncbi:MAG: hypothetical protein M0042_06530 [Nitrospiraceae bacterium]|nr:hypothetical protein [Nitrospiraceae bacterium]